MHQAPAVQVCCSGSAEWRTLRCLLGGVAAAVFVGWVLLRSGAPSYAAWAASAAVALVIFLLIWRATRESDWALGWDGARWWFASDATSNPVDVQTMDVMIDLGGWLLLRARLADGASRWVAVSRGNASTDHKALCTALYAQRSISTMPALPDQPPR